MNREQRRANDAEKSRRYRARKRAEKSGDAGDAGDASPTVTGDATAAELARGRGLITLYQQEIDRIEAGLESGDAGDAWSRVTGDASPAETLTPQGSLDTQRRPLRPRGAASDAESSNPVKLRTFETLSDAVEYMTADQKRALLERSLTAHDAQIERNLAEGPDGVRRMQTEYRERTAALDEARLQAQRNRVARDPHLKAELNAAIARAKTMSDPTVDPTARALTYDEVYPDGQDGTALADYQAIREWLPDPSSNGNGNGHH